LVSVVPITDMTAVSPLDCGQLCVKEHNISLFMLPEQRFNGEEFAQAYQSA
jgi:hypothetical protein